MYFLSKALSLLSLTAASLASVAASELNLLDLSEEWVVGNIQNTDAAELSEYISRDVRRFLVIDNGVIVEEYQRNNVNDGDAFELFSATKAVMSMIIGTIIYNPKYNLTVDMTMGEIFAGNEIVWTGISNATELAFKQQITIEEMLTMTSGLYPLPSLGTALQIVLDTPNSAGVDLPDSLASPLWSASKKGVFVYSPTSNILSYVVKEVTGMTPWEYAAVDVFPYLGMLSEHVVWRQNADGMESSFSGIKLTARQMAKIAQLYLQKGMASPTKRLLSEEYVKASLSIQASGFIPDFTQGAATNYGYLWVQEPFNSTLVPNTIGDHMWCGYGFLGQSFCFNYESNRVVAFQRSNTLWDKNNVFALLYMAQKAFDANRTWDIAVQPSLEPPSVESGAFFLSGVSVAMVALSCLAIWL